MGEVGLMHLGIQLINHWKSNGVPFKVARNTKIKYPASVYVSGYIVPTLDAMNSGNDLFMNK